MYIPYVSQAMYLSASAHSVVLLVWLDVVPELRFMYVWLEINASQLARDTSPLVPCIGAYCRSTYFTSY